MGHYDNITIQPVSVIIPVYNGERYLCEAIESVLCQSYKSFELIVIDDGSTDRTREISLSYPEVKYIFQTNRGVAAARNQGIKYSRAEFIAFLDADDLWQPEKLTLQMKAFENNPDLEMVTGHVEQFVSPEVEKSIAQKYVYPEKPLPGYSPSVFLIKRSAFTKTGLFPISNPKSENVLWFSNALEKGINILILPDVIARRRIHGNNATLKDQKERNSEIMRILKEKIDRKRNRARNRDN